MKKSNDVIWYLTNNVNTEIAVNDKRINFNPKPISKSKQLFTYICLIEAPQENDTQITDSCCTKVYTYCIGTLVKLSFQNTVAFHPLHYTEQPKWNNGPRPSSDMVSFSNGLLPRPVLREFQMQDCLEV